MKLFGFSLIELMVVIAIIGVLAAIAVPAYTIYGTRASLQKYVSLMQNASHDAQSYYSRGEAFPSTLTFDGVSIPALWTAVGSNQIYSMIYNVSADGKGISMAVNLSGFTSNQISGYVAPTSVNPTAKSVFWYALRDFDGVMKSACGWYTNGGVDLAESIPMIYLPTNCQCQNVSDFYISGTGGC